MGLEVPPPHPHSAKKHTQARQLGQSKLRHLSERSRGSERGEMKFGGSLVPVRGKRGGGGGRDWGRQQGRKPGGEGWMGEVVPWSEEEMWSVLGDILLRECWVWVPGGWVRSVGGDGLLGMTVVGDPYDPIQPTTPTPLESPPLAQTYTFPLSTNHSPFPP